MSCPTCDGTMRGIATEGIRIHLCPRCGTVKQERLGAEEIYVPTLVERCRKFQKLMADNDDEITNERWKKVGIAESINTPEARPT